MNKKARGASVEMVATVGVNVSCVAWKDKVVLLLSNLSGEADRFNKKLRKNVPIKCPFSTSTTSSIKILHITNFDISISVRDATNTLTGLIGRTIMTRSPFYLLWVLEGLVSQR